MTMSNRLDQIETRLRAATPGEWSVYPVRYEFAITTAGGPVADAWTAHDAALIANAPADLAALLRVARAAARAIPQTDWVATDEEAWGELVAALDDLTKEAAQ
jgi:hypothetical protein